MQRFRLIIIPVYWFLHLTLQGQEINLYNHYLENEMSVNPAFTGKENAHVFQLSHRQQWIGFGSNSALQVLSAQTRLSNSGLGALIYYDNNGPTHRIYGKASYAFHIPMYSRGFSHQNEKGTNLSFGLSFSTFRNWLDKGSLSTYDTGDPVMNHSLYSPFLFDADAGVCLYSPKFNISLSAYQILEPVVNYTGLNSQFLLTRSYLFYTSYSFKLTNRYILEPILFLRLSERLDKQLDFGSKFVFSDKLWISLISRNINNHNLKFNSSIIAFAGFRIFNNLYGTYSFDYSLNGLAFHTFGSHQVSIIYKIPIKPVCPGFDQPSRKPSKWNKIFR